MRFRELIPLFAAWLLSLTIARPVEHAKTTSLVFRRDLLGLLGEVDGTARVHQETSMTALIPVDITTGPGRISPTSTLLASTESTSTSPTLTSSTKASPTKTLTSMTPSLTGPDPSTVTFSSTPYSIGYAAEAPTTPPGELTEWKVIGIAVITITFIATTILAVAFFDSWWGFVRDSLCGRARRAGERIGGETLIPDWEKRSWEFQLANENGHRYPTVNSLESIVREKEQVKPLKLLGEHDIKSPEMAYGGMA